MKMALTILSLASLLTPSLIMEGADRRPIAALSAKVKEIPFRDFSKLYGMDGFSDKLLSNHFKLYQGYVKSTNAILALLDQLQKEGKERSLEYGTLKKSLGWEKDGIVLHELYFENLGGKEPLPEGTPLYQRIVADFGSFDEWKKDFIATGMMRGIGWVILYEGPNDNKLTNCWIGEHDVGHLAGGKPLLVMDVWEHAYMTDYAINRESYIQAFFRNIDWELVQQRAKKGGGAS